MQPWGYLLLFTAFVVSISWDLLFVNATHIIADEGQQLSYLFPLILRPTNLLIFALLTAPFIIRFKAISWQNIEYNKAFRAVLLLCAFLLVWIFSFDTYNFYLNHWFLADRILLAVLAIGILFHPVFLPLFTSATIIFYAQYFPPFDWLYNYDIRPLFSVLFVGFSVVLLGKAKVKAAHILTLLVVIQLSSYFFSGIAKLAISPTLVGWVTDNELFMLALNTHLRGWMHAAGSGYYNAVTAFYKTLHIPITLFILAIETGCVFALANKKLAKWLLILICLMHLAIFITAGIAFWIWTVINLAIIVLLYKKPEGFVFFSGKWSWLKSATIVCFGVLAFHPLYYAWFDSRCQWIMEIEVTDDQGQTYSFDKNNFGGYSYAFVHAAVKRAIPEKIPGNNGYSASQNEVQYYRNATLSNIDSIIEITGTNHYDEAWAQKFNGFLHGYFTEYNQLENRVHHGWLARAPRQLYMYQPQLPKLPEGHQVKHCNIIIKEYLYTDDTGYQNFNTFTISSLDIPLRE